MKEYQREYYLEKEEKTYCISKRVLFKKIEKHNKNIKENIIQKIEMKYYKSGLNITEIK